MTIEYQEPDDDFVDWEETAKVNPSYYKAFDLMDEVIAEEVDGEILPKQEA